MGGLAQLARSCRPSRQRLRRQRLPADERPAGRVGHRTDRGFRDRSAGTECRSVRHRQRGHARQPADGGDPRAPACPSSRGRSGSRSTCCAGAMCLPWPERTGRRRRRRCWRRCSTSAGRDPGIPRRAACRRTSAARRSSGAARPSSSRRTSTTRRSSTSARSSSITFRSTAVLNNLEFDHADIFPDLAAIETQFHHFVRTLRAFRPRGRERRRTGACARSRARLLVGAGVVRRRRRMAGGARRSPPCPAQGAVVGELEIALPGHHNRMNALAALVAAGHAGVEPAVALAALQAIQGRQAPPGGARHRRRSDRHRRLRAPSDRDSRNDRRPAGARAGADRRDPRAALEHDEAGRDEGAAARRASSAPIACSATPVA